MNITSADRNIIVENEEDKSISVQNKDIMVVNSEPEFEVTVQRKEYSIVGDELYIPKRYEDAPQWLRDLISTVTEESYARKITDLNNLSKSLQQLIVELEVAKNTYTQSIISSNDINERINTAITTLNSSLSSSDATIVDLISTKATPEEASAIALNTISSSINNGEIGALIGSISNTLATETEALANNIDLIHAEMSNGFEGTADAIQITQAYVGIDENGGSTGTGLLADVSILQKQNDGIIETVTGTYDVMINPQDPNLAELVLTAEPYASWKAKDVSGIDTRLAHIGDVYIKYNTTSNGAREYIASYKFIRTTVDSTSPYSTDSDGFTWALIIDQAAQDAYEQALNAYDLADNKRRVFVNTPYVPYDIGDLWLVQAGAAIIGTTQGGRVIQVGDVLRCSEAKTTTGLYENNDWIPADNYRESMEAIKSNLQGQIDGKVDTYYQGTVPTGMTALNNGDYWYCTADVSTYKKGKVYKYVHATTSWVETADVSRYAFDVADGKAAIFTSTNVPTTGYKVNDMLIVIGSFNNGTTTFSDGVVLSSNANRVSGFTPADWVKKINDTEDLDAFVSGTYTSTVASLQSQVDGQISYYFFDSSLGQSAASVSGSSSWTTDALKKEHNGDIAYDTKLEVGYWYDRSVSNWVQITGAQNAGVIEALKKAAEAKESADNVIVSYYAWKQTTAPATQYKWMKDDNTLWEYVGSTWVVVDVKKDDTLTAYNNTTKDTTLYVHNGSVWTMITPNGIVANSKAVTDLNASLSSLGTTVSGHTSLLNTVDARIGSEGARAESKFAYDSTLVLNGTSYSSGFGIATSLTSGSGLPTGQSEFWIKADKFKLMSADGGKKSSYSPFTVDSVTGEINFNGKVSFTNVSDTQGSGTNLLYNSAPKIGNETKGWSIGWSNHGLSSSIGAGNDPWRPTSGASVYIVVPGSPGIGTVFDINNSKFPVMANTRYEASAYLSSHRCDSRVTLAWFDINGNYISESSGTSNSNASSGPLAGWSRSTMFATAPSNAATAQFYVRSVVTSNDPYCFVAYAYAGIASTNQTIPSNWSEGSSAGVSSGDVVNDINAGNTTTIDGRKITTESITALQIQADSALINKLNVVGGIEASTLTANVIYNKGADASNYSMKIDLLNGEIHIK